MAQYSNMSNKMSTFTDCPGREKLAYPADYLQPFATLHRHFEYDAYLRTMERHLAEGQSKAGDNIGNVALKAPVYDWGYTRPVRRRDQLGRRDHPGAVVALRDVRRHADDGPVLPADAGVPRTTSGPRRRAPARTAHRRRRARGLGRGRPDDLGPDHRHVGVPPDRRPHGRRWPPSPATTPTRPSTASSPPTSRTAFNTAFYNSALGRYTSEGTRAPPAQRRPRRPSRSTRALSPTANAGGSSTRSSSWSTATSRSAAGRTSAAAPSGCADRARAHRRGPRRRAVGRAPGGHAAELRVLHGADHGESGRPHDDAGALGHGRLEEPHDPRRRSRSGSRAVWPASGRRAAPSRYRKLVIDPRVVGDLSSRRRQLPDAVRQGRVGVDPQARHVPARGRGAAEHHRRGACADGRP